MHLVFAVLQEVRDSPEQLTVHVSQFEVYNEQIYDLLAEEAGAVLGQRPALRLKEDSQGRIFVRGLSEVSTSFCLSWLMRAMYHVSSATGSASPAF